MYVKVNGVRIYFDVENAGLVADGPKMREKPTLVLLHGGPGFDHTIFKPAGPDPAWAALTDLAQIIYIDHRGNGRSDDGDPSTWNLAQWGDDVKGFCDALGIVKPIVSGTSFGGFVAQSYATRHPAHPSKLILISTAAKFELAAIFDAFERLGGAEIRAIAEDRWLRPTPISRAIYIKRCFPFYRTRGSDVEFVGRAISKDPVAMHFSGPGREAERLDFRAALSRVQCPTLVLAGEQDPITPVAFSEVIAASLPQHLMRFERFNDCGHGVVQDQPETGFGAIRSFIKGV
jgi:pimeloyl-ACP methyl ester carboxylesterase